MASNDISQDARGAHVTNTLPFFSVCPLLPRRQVLLPGHLRSPKVPAAYACVCVRQIGGVSRLPTQVAYVGVPGVPWGAWSRGFAILLPSNPVPQE